MLQRAAACPFRIGSLPGLGEAFLVGLGGGGVQFDQGLAGLYVVAFLHQDAADDAALQRLHELGPVADDDAPGRHGDDVDLAEDGPQQRDGEERHQHEGDAPGGGMDGGFLQAQRSRQKSLFIGQPGGAGQFGAVLPSGTQHVAVAGKQFDGGVAWRPVHGVVRWVRP